MCAKKKGREGGRGERGEERRLFEQTTLKEYRQF
jgi:hypothetical protein